MFDLDRMKKALEGPIVMIPPGIPRELRRKWVKVMHKGTPINEFIDKLCEDDPDFKQVLEATRKKMYEDGTMDKLKAIGPTQITTSTSPIWWSLSVA